MLTSVWLLISSALFVGVPGHEVGHGNEQDLECFAMMFPMQTIGIATGGASHLETMRLGAGAAEHGLTASPTSRPEAAGRVLKITQGAFEKNGHGDNCCGNKLEDTVSLSFSEGDTKVIEMGYTPLGSMLQNRDPRNLTLHYSEGLFYVGMARLDQTQKMVTQEQGWIESNMWTCDQSSRVFNPDNEDDGKTKVLFYKGVMSATNELYVRNEAYVWVGGSPSSSTQTVPSALTTLTILLAVMLTLFK